jgi:hypothetical protein
MRKPPTGEPCAGEPLARFGGRGGATLPDPYLASICNLKITEIIADMFWISQIFYGFKSADR